MRAHRTGFLLDMDGFFGSWMTWFTEVQETHTTNGALTLGNFVRLATDPDPVRVRAAWVTDPDIRAMVTEYAPPPRLRPVKDGAA